MLCGYGGIGRRARFRFWCLRRAGSSPVIRRKGSETPENKGFQRKKRVFVNGSETLFFVLTSTLTSTGSGIKLIRGKVEPFNPIVSYVIINNKREYR